MWNSPSTFVFLSHFLREQVASLFSAEQPGVSSFIFVDRSGNVGSWGIDIHSSFRWRKRILCVQVSINVAVKHVEINKSSASIDEDVP